MILYWLRCVLALALTCTATTACVVSFRKSSEGLSTSLRKVYFPAVRDSSSRGGAAGRVSYALRRAIALRTEISLVPVDEASLGIDVEVRKQNRVTTKETRCPVDKSQHPTLAAEAYVCDDAALGLGRARVAAEEETLSLTVVTRGYDLNSGALLFSKDFLISKNYNIISDDAGIRHRLHSKYSENPALYHSFRYLENADKAVDDISGDIAGQLISQILSIRPSSTE